MYRQPSVIILDVKRQVRALENMLKYAHGLKQSPFDIYERLIVDAQVKYEGYQRLLDFVAEVTRSLSTLSCAGLRFSDCGFPETM